MLKVKQGTVVTGEQSFSDNGSVTRKAVGGAEAVAARAAENALANMHTLMEHNFIRPASLP
jgi:hypothetical protein